MTPDGYVQELTQELGQELTTTRASALPLAAPFAACTALAGCAGERPQSATTPGLETGIASSNGGGTRALANQPNVGVTTRVGSAR